MILVTYRSIVASEGEVVTLVPRAVSVAAGVPEAPFHLDIGLRNANVGVVGVLVGVSAPVENSHTA
jgi:hypothetical protein